MKKGISAWFMIVFILFTGSLGMFWKTTVSSASVTVIDDSAKLISVVNTEQLVSRFIDPSIKEIVSKAAYEYGKTESGAPGRKNLNEYPSGFPYNSVMDDIEVIIRNKLSTFDTQEREVGGMKIKYSAPQIENINIDAVCFTQDQNAVIHSDCVAVKGSVDIEVSQNQPNAKIKVKHKFGYDSPLTAHTKIVEMIFFANQMVFDSDYNFEKKLPEKLTEMSGLGKVPYKVEEKNEETGETRTINVDVGAEELPEAVIAAKINEYFKGLKDKLRTDFGSRYDYVFDNNINLEQIEANETGNVNHVVISVVSNVDIIDTGSYVSVKEKTNSVNGKSLGVDNLKLLLTKEFSFDLYLNNEEKITVGGN